MEACTRVVIGWEAGAGGRAGTVVEVEACARVVIGWEAEAGTTAGTTVEADVRACAFAVADSASGFVRLPDRSPPA